MLTDYFFKPRGRLLLQLGDELIRDEGVAILELVKNAYDADSPEVTITMTNIDEETYQNGTIVIEDEGEGMDKKTIEEAWMEPGTDIKRKKIEANERTKKFKRLVLGEKGIGRFAIHKLGKLVEIITRKENEKELIMKIDWTAFEKNQYLEDLPVTVTEREPEVFVGEKTGTKIIISNLREPWTRQQLRNLYRSVNAMSSPFKSVESFEFTFKTDKQDWLEHLSSWEEIKEKSLFYFYSELEGNKITKFTYKFTPYTTMEKLEGRTIFENDELVKKRLILTDLDANEINLDVDKTDNLNENEDEKQKKIGKVIFEGHIFDRTPKILSLGIEDKRGFKEFLGSNGGVRIYRDNIRVYDYGEKGNDWLGLDAARVNSPVESISNNQIVSAIFLDREHSSGLTEMTNREGFLQNKWFFKLKDAITHVLQLIENCRSQDKEKMHVLYGSGSKTEPVVSKIDELRKAIESKVKNPEIKNDLIVSLKRIEIDYKKMNETLLKSAGAGLHLSAGIHQAEKIIVELIKVVEKESVSDRIKELLSRLVRVVESYSILIKGGGMKEWDFKQLINEAVFDVEFRLQDHKVELVKDYLKFNGNSRLSCVKNLVVTTLLNFLDNSIWWLKYGKVQKKKIHISITESLKDHITILFADNGPGFTLPPEEMVKPFASGKPGGSGLGLHIADQVMISHGGLLIFPDKGDFDIPKEFEDGAVLAIAFKKMER